MNVVRFHFSFNSSQKSLKLVHLTLLLKLVIKSDDFVLVVKVKTFSAVLFLMNLEIYDISKESYHCAVWRLGTWLSKLSGHGYYNWDQSWDFLYSVYRVLWIIQSMEGKFTFYFDLTGTLCMKQSSKSSLFVSAQNFVLIALALGSDKYRLSCGNLFFSYTR